MQSPSVLREHDISFVFLGLSLFLLCFFSVFICTSLKLYQVIEWSENACYCFSKPSAIFAGSSLSPLLFCSVAELVWASRSIWDRKMVSEEKLYPVTEFRPQRPLGVSYTCSSAGGAQLRLPFKAPLKALLAGLVHRRVSLHIYVSGWKKSQHLAPLYFVHGHTQMVTLLLLATRLTAHALLQI